MKEYIYSFDITKEELNSFILKQDFSETTYMLLENITEINFDFFSSDTDFSPWTQGRIFDQERELKWRALGSICRVVIITQEEDIPGHNHRDELPRAEEDRCFYLWGIEAYSKNNQLQGNFKQNHFIERSIPKKLSYPLKQILKKDSRAALLVRPYNNTSGILRYYRFLGLEVKDGK